MPAFGGGRPPRTEGLQGSVECVVSAFECNLASNFKYLILLNS